jgi:hypothetical protein
MFAVTLDSEAAGDWQMCIYAFLVGDEVKRIGSSKAPLCKRLREWECDVTRALRGRRSRPSAREAVMWSECLQTHRVGEIYARIGTVVTTPVGALNTYLAEESALIGKHRPPMNWSKHR